MTAEHDPLADVAISDEQAAVWLDATAHRRSRRRYTGAAVTADVLNTLDEVCEGFHPFGDARVVLVREPGDGVFHGIVGAYGRVSGAPHVLLVVADERTAHAHAHAGYTGEAAILAATALGLDTCWIGGFFRPAYVRRLVTLEQGERVVAVSPVGHATGALGVSERMLRGAAGSRGRKPLEEIAPGIDETWPEWARAAAETVRIGPSAMNRQPWRLRMEEGSLVVSRDAPREVPRVTRALDCGIAMLHAELGAYREGVRGRWVDASAALDVARFEPHE